MDEALYRTLGTVVDPAWDASVARPMSVKVCSFLSTQSSSPEEVTQCYYHLLGGLVGSR